MKKILILLSLFIIGLISAASYSGTSSLNFNTIEGQQICQNMHFYTSYDKVMISDGWLPEGKVFKLSNLVNGSNMGITTIYPKNLIGNQQEFQVCFKADNPGEYKGTLLIAPYYEEEINGENVVHQIVQFGVWLRANVTADANKPIEIQSIEVNETVVLDNWEKSIYSIRKASTLVERECYNGRTIQLIVLNDRNADVYWTKGCMLEGNDWIKPESEWKVSKYREDKTNTYKVGMLYSNRVIQDIEVKDYRGREYTYVYWTRK